MDSRVGGRAGGLLLSVLITFILRLEASGGILDENLSDFKMWLSLTAVACQYLLCVCALRVY